MFTPTPTPNAIVRPHDASAYQELEQIIKFKDDKLRKNYDYRMNLRTANKVLGEEKLRKVINEVVHMSFVENMRDYYESSTTRRANENLLLPLNSSKELEALATDTVDPARVSKIQQYYFECYKNGKLSYLVHARHNQDQDSELSTALVDALMEENPTYRVANRFYAAEAQTKMNKARVQRLVFEKEVLDKNSAMVDIVGTEEDESAAILYWFLVKVKNILKDHPAFSSINLWIIHLSGVVGFRRQFEIFESCEKLLNELQYLDEETDESLKSLLHEAKKRIRRPKSETELEVLELCMTLRAKMIRYCASKFEKYDIHTSDKMKQVFKQATFGARDKKLESVENLLLTLDEKIEQLLEGNVVKRNEIITLIENFHLNGSNLPEELVKITHPVEGQLAPAQEPVAVPSPNAGVVISIPHKHVQSQEKQRVLWDFALSDFTAEKCTQNVRKILENYGRFVLASEVDEVMSLIPPSDLRDLPERLRKVAVNGQVNVCQVLEELNPSDRRDMRLSFLLGNQQKTDNELTQQFRNHWGRALIRQYELLVGKLMNIYEVLPDKKYANDLILKALGQMVPLVQRNFNDEFADSIEDTLYDLALDKSDFRGNTIADMLHGARIYPLPTLKEFTQFQDQAKTLLYSVPQDVQKKVEAERRSFHFFN